MTNNLNSLADGIMCPLDFSPSDRRPLLPLVEPDGAPSDVKAVFDEACAFYEMARPPHVLLAAAADPGFVRDLWPAVPATFEPGHLDRLTKEILALAASVTAKSPYGVDFHLREVRRLGLPDGGVLEVLQVTQMFNGFTKIADALRLAPDDFAPVPTHRDRRAAPAPAD
ncbi:MAG: carboxymuconolactone decarboxylase family protein [Candidatus Rokuibacteriota bacterium]